MYDASNEPARTTMPYPAASADRIDAIDGSNVIEKRVVKRIMGFSHSDDRASVAMQFRLVEGLKSLG